MVRQTMTIQCECEYYCSDDECYEHNSSGQPKEGELPAFIEYDPLNSGNDDGTFENRQYDSRTTVPEIVQVPWFQHRPVQLASKSSGFDTFDDIIEYTRRQVEIELNAEIEHERELQKDRDEMDALMVEAMQEDKDRFNATLPTESKLGKMNRIEKEKEALALKVKMSAKARKEKFANQKSLPFGHRRNGGGKNKIHAPAAPEVIAARRAAKRKARKDEKRVEEAARSAHFEKEKLNKISETETSSSESASDDDEMSYIRQFVAAKVNVSQVMEVVKVEEAKVEVTKVEEAKVEVTKVEVAKVDTWEMVSRRKNKNSQVIEPIVLKVEDLKMGAAPYNPPKPTDHRSTAMSK